MLTLNLLAESHGAACVDAEPEGPWIDAAGNNAATLGAACAGCGYARTPSNAPLHRDCIPPDAAAICRALADAIQCTPLPSGRVLMYFVGDDGQQRTVEAVNATEACREYARREERRARRAGRTAS